MLVDPSALNYLAPSVHPILERLLLLYEDHQEQ